jgi:hypothetical protein
MMMMNKLKRLSQLLVKENPRKKEYATTFIWFHYVTTGLEISLVEINKYFLDCDLPKYNPTYLKNDLRLSKNIIKGSKPNTYKPVNRYSDELSEKFQFVVEKGEDIHTDDIILPNSLVNDTRGYIVSLSKQINSSYNNNIFDGCAILMRRLLEILLIHSYEAHNKAILITESDGYKNLSYIINYTCSNKPFPLSKDAMETLDSLRVIGNFSAHRIQYNAKRKDIDNVKLHYRLTIEELLYASKIKN